jgi:hypothetical protein
MDTTTSTVPDRRLTLNQLYAGCALILLGAVVGLAGEQLDAASGLALGTAVIGAGATLLPSHAAAGIVTAALGGNSAPTDGDAATAPTPAQPSADDRADALAAEDPTLAGVDLAGTNGDGDPAAATAAVGAGRQADGDL